MELFSFSTVSRDVYSTNELLSATNKNVLPALQKNQVIDQFSCHCGSRYIGRTSQRLRYRIKQHVPKSMCCCSSFQKRLLLARRCKSSPRLIPSLLLLIQPLDFIFYKILPVLNMLMITVDFLFSPMAAHFSNYLLLKPISSKLLTPTSADKKNS